MNRSIELSFKSKVKKIAEERRITPSELWEIIALERFLVRVASSPYAANFILKGGLLLASYVDMKRHTRDLDFLLTNLSNQISDLSRVLAEIILTPIEDSFQFDGVDVHPLEHPHMRYPGARATTKAFFGKTRFKLTIDLGFGDIVQPLRRDYPLASGREGALFESHVEINCYPKEFIVAEKLEAVCFHGAENSRMKDFHDLYVLFRQPNELDPGVRQIIISVFEHRGTNLDLPLSFSHITLDKMQVQWNNHIRRLFNPMEIPDSFTEVIDAINLWVMDNIHREPAS